MSAPTPVTGDGSVAKGRIWLNPDAGPVHGYARIDFRSGPTSPGPERAMRRRLTGGREAPQSVAVPVPWFWLCPPGLTSWPARRTCAHLLSAGRPCVLSPGHASTHLPAPGGAR